MGKFAVPCQDAALNSWLRPRGNSTLSAADDIRAYAIRHYVAPARAAGNEEAAIRLGEIRTKMQLAGPLQSVRSALGSKLFQELAGVELVEPINRRAGADTCCRFRVRSTTDCARGVPS